MTVETANHPPSASPSEVLHPLRTMRISLQVVALVLGPKARRAPYLYRGTQRKDGIPLRKARHGSGTIRRDKGQFPVPQKLSPNGWISTAFLRGQGALNLQIVRLIRPDQW